MALDPRIMQQYIDEYQKQAANWQRKGTQYNKAIKAYNESLNTFNTQTQPQLKGLMEAYNAELQALNNQINLYNQNLGDQDRAKWDNFIAEARATHYGNANARAAEMAKLEQTMPRPPSIASALFNEKLYLANNPDVAAAVQKGQFKSGLEHYLQQGYKENRNAASGGQENEKQLREAAAWQADADAVYKSYSNAVNQSRLIGTYAEQWAKYGTPDIDTAMGGYSMADDRERVNALVSAAYQTYLGRAPNTEGLNFWANAITNGVRTPQQVIGDIQQSDEGKAYAANQTKTVNSALSAYASNKTPANANNLVSAAYQTYLGRSADSAGLNYWASAINSGTDPQTVLNTIKQSQEATAYTENKIKPLNSALSGYNAGYEQDTRNLIAAAFRTYLGRDPDAEGLNYWTSEVTSGRMSPQQLTAALKGSTESTAFGSKAIDSQKAVDEANKQKAAYEAVQGKRPGLDWFAGQKTPGRITNALATGDPDKIVKSAYSAYLGRQPDQAGLKYWADSIRAGTSAQETVNAIRKSEEGTTFGGQFHGVAPSFTSQQLNQMQGQMTLAQQERSGQNEVGLINRVQGQKQKPDSIIGGILQTARYST